MPIVIVVVVIVILLVAYISTSNGLNKALIKIDEASSDIDVSLTKRYDVLTKMIDVVKGYAKYEQETLLKTIEIRKGMTMKEKNEANRIMEENTRRINALAENYPDLKASENYRTLQKAIADVEEHLQASRRLYNSNVSIYNQKIVMFPSNIVASVKGLTKKEFFSAEENKREDVKIDL
jgi:LemA protein